MKLHFSGDSRICTSSEFPFWNCDIQVVVQSYNVFNTSFRWASHLVAHWQCSNLTPFEQAPFTYRLLRGECSKPVHCASMTRSAGCNNSLDRFFLCRSALNRRRSVPKVASEQSLELLPLGNGTVSGSNHKPKCRVSIIQRLSVVSVIASLCWIKSKLRHTNLKRKPFAARHINTCLSVHLKHNSFSVKHNFFNCC